MNMRLILLISILPAILFSCGGRQEGNDNPPSGDFRMLKLLYENSTGEKAVTHFHYDPRGFNYLAIWHLDDSSRSSVNHHTLDSAGRVIVKSREFSDGIHSVQHFEYDPRGNLVREDFSRSDGITGHADYFYGPDGKLGHADCRGLNGWFYGEIRYTWENGRKTGAVLMQDSVPTGNIAYEYQDGRLTREHWDFKGGWSQTFRYQYHDAAPRTFASPSAFIRENPWYRIRSEFYEFNGKPGGPTVYSYDESGQLISREYTRADGLSTLSTYEYDTSGLIVQSLREYGDGRSMDALYWYSVDRRLLLKTFTSTDGTSGSETYRYKDGRLIRGEYVNVDGWLNGTLEFNHDEYGTIRSAVYSAKDGPDAVADFSYDLNFNLVKIHWEFGSGQTQTYHYAYEACR